MVKQCTLIVLFFTSFLVSDQIKIYNGTRYDLYAAIYYTEDPIIRATPVLSLPQKKSLPLERPPNRDCSFILPYYCDTNLVISADKDTLQQHLNRHKLNNLFWSNIGSVWGSSFYLNGKIDQLRLYTKMGYYLRDPVSLLSNALEHGFLKINEFISEYLSSHLSQERADPYKHLTAYVRRSMGIGHDEHHYLIQRKKRVKEILEALIEIPVITVPTISIVCSGGKQAVLATLGWLNGLQKIGLLDCTTYISSHSTSSLVVAPWISTGYTCTQLKHYLRTILTTKQSIPSSLALKLIGSALLKRVAYGHPISLTDLYGSLVGNNLLHAFENKSQQLFLHEQAKQVESGQVPFPLYTVVECNSRNWFELTPFEVGCPSKQSYIPTWAFGKKFEYGESVDFSCAYTLASILGMVSSSYISEFIEVYDHVLQSLPVSLPIRNVKKGSESCSILFNFTDEEQGFLHLTDASTYFPLAYPPLLQKKAVRTSDILLVLDASDGEKDALQQMKVYADKQGINLPLFDYAELEKKPVMIIEDETNIQAPLIIYCSLHKSTDTKALEGLPFACSDRYFDELVSLTEKSIIDNNEDIIDAITWYVDKRNRSLS